jgi:hypothetical protein
MFDILLQYMLTRFESRLLNSDRSMMVILDPPHTRVPEPEEEVEVEAAEATTVTELLADAFE